MAVFEVVTIGDPLLREKAKAVTKITPNIFKLLKNMADTMYDTRIGVGLAAPQIGISKRVVVIDVGEGIIELINPELISGEGSEIDTEGCLSVPGVTGKVERCQKVKVRALDRHSKPFVIEAEGLLARALQHEIDHLEGILFVDRAKKLNHG